MFQPLYALAMAMDDIKEPVECPHSPDGTLRVRTHIAHENASLLSTSPTLPRPTVVFESIRNVGHSHVSSPQRGFAPVIGNTAGFAPGAELCNSVPSRLSSFGFSSSRSRSLSLSGDTGSG